jgi:hypothetical protein
MPPVNEVELRTNEGITHEKNQESHDVAELFIHFHFYAAPAPVKKMRP